MNDDGFKNNAMASSGSAYLREHAENPVWWREWNKETLDYARSAGKPIFVSSGYSSCRWCHVMAAEAFSDRPTADFLNERFVSIKVDREARPDVDQYLMNFMHALNGSGGWPLNVFLTCDLRPVYALTYAPPEARGGMISFLEISRKVLDYIDSHDAEIEAFDFAEPKINRALESDVKSGLLSRFDGVYGGFGLGAKFPPHSTLLFMLYHLAAESDRDIEIACRATLDAMARNGLRDHLGGGFFRYCTDRRWSVPHFEKMLYDQASALWAFSLASKVFGESRYAEIADEIVACLERDFLLDGFFATAIDAETDRREGETYLWTLDEIKTTLNADEFAELSETFYLPPEGNFEGKIHLLRKKNGGAGAAIQKLLAKRLKRKQPFTDTTIISGQNALTACALFQYARMTGRPEYEAKAIVLLDKLIERFDFDGKFYHSAFAGQIRMNAYLADLAALTLALSYACESDGAYLEITRRYANRLEEFRGPGGDFIESNEEDFRPAPASGFDHPAPSSVSMAETALIRLSLLEGRPTGFFEYLSPHAADFYNIGVMLSKGLFHEYHTESPMNSRDLPANSIQTRGKPESVCFRGECRPL